MAPRKPVPLPQRIRFGAFELDVRAAELRKHGIKVRLHEQPFRILLMLLDRPGEVVLRDEIRLTLWPNNTIVEFDHSINAAIQRLRDALSDSADNPRYVETVARRGYRFVGTVEPAEPAPVEETRAQPAAQMAGVDPSDLSGQTLSHFRLIGKLGSGGMGVVYRAEDLKLGREVALKFLPIPASEASAQMIERFEREARAASALNHPNICTIYGVEELAGQPVIEMELVEGETLAARIAREALPLDRALPLAIQIASALDAAHRKRIVHRDLKPANIMVTKSGAKVLDFGLAKIAQSSVGRQETATQMTQAGTILGTWQYMSPEQVQGNEADARSDIFSFGCVMLEMLTGKQAFEGKTPAELTSAILTKDPLASGSMPSIPTAVERVIRHCLEKSPEERFQSAHDLAFALEAIVAGREEVRPATALRSRPRLPYVTIWAALAGAAMLIVTVLWLRRPPPPTFELASHRQGTIYRARFSPDGQTVVYSAGFDGNPIDIFTARRDDPEARSLGLVGSTLLAVSRKGQLAVLTNATYLYHYDHTGTLALVPFGGGTPREILTDVREADFAPDGETLAVVRTENGKTSVDYPAGRTLYETAGWVDWLRISPDGSRLAFFSHPSDRDDSGEVIMVDRSGRQEAVSRGWEGLEGLAWPTNTGDVWFSGARSGNDLAIYAVAAGGRERLVLAGPGTTRLHDVAPDGHVLLSHDFLIGRVAVQIAGENRERDLSFLEYSGRPYFSPDGKFIVFNDDSAANGPYYAACMRKIDGSPAVRLGEGVPTDVSPDGHWVLSIRLSDPPQLQLLPTGAGQTSVLPRGKIAGYDYAAFFHDGRRVLFSANEPGRAKRVFIQDLAGGEPRPITAEGVVAPFDNPIAPDDRSLALTDSSGTLVRVTLGSGAPPAPFPGVQPGDTFLGWAGDGKRIFVYQPPELRPRIFVVDLENGLRTLWKQFEPANPVGLHPFDRYFATLTPDGRNVAYSYGRELDRLYLAEGLR